MTVQELDVSEVDVRPYTSTRVRVSLADFSADDLVNQLNKAEIGELLEAIGDARCIDHFGIQVQE